MRAEGAGGSLLSRDITSEACCADNANLISNKQICPISNNAGTPPNLKDKQRFRMCQPLVWLCEKVTAALSGKKQDTNYPLPPELKKLLEHVLSKHDHCGTFFLLHPWHEIPPPFFFFLLVWAYFLERSSSVSQKSPFHCRLQTVCASASAETMACFASGSVACTPLWGQMCFRWCVFPLWSLFGGLYLRFLLCPSEKPI